VCYLGRGLGVDYYHCTVRELPYLSSVVAQLLTRPAPSLVQECNMCFDKRYQASHKHITHKKMAEVVPPVDDEEEEAEG